MDLDETNCMNILVFFLHDSSLKEVCHYLIVVSSSKAYYIDKFELM